MSYRPWGRGRANPSETMARETPKRQENTRPSTSDYEVFEHPADLGIRGWGRTLEEAFTNAATALFEVITEPDKVHQEEEIDFEVESDDREALLVDFLNELVSSMDI